jgi:V/A-type H+/Na+-transporting ATPase subunit E
MRVPAKRGKDMPLETADNKVKEICAILRKETLEPAKAEAKKIIEVAQKEADELIHRAKDDVLKIREENRKELAKELKVHEGSIQLSIRQGISSLRQNIEKIFSRDLGSEIEKVMGKEDAVANAISVIFGLLEKDGLAVNLGLMIPKHVNLDAICHKLVGDFSERVRKGAIQIEDIKGGAEVKLNDKKMSIDLTDNAVKELLASFVIPELRAKIFCDGR